MKPISADINDLLQIKFPDDPDSPSSASRVDDIVDERLLIAWPTEGGVLVPVHQNQSLTISFVRDDAIYTFTGIVEDMRRIPINQVTIRPASSCERIQRRQFFRAKIVLSVDFVMQDGLGGQGDSKPRAQAFKAFTYDISGSGLAIRQKAAVPSGSLLEAKFHLPGEQNEIKVLCQVVHCTNLSAASEEKLHHFGMHFLAISEANRTRIVRHVFKAQHR
jgi:c-di-GMP-binding flagellar brake protein YcgR